MGLLSTLALLDEGALFLHLRPQRPAQGWAQGSRESGMLYGEGSPQAWGGKPEASPRQDDLAESACWMFWEGFLKEKLCCVEMVPRS